MNVTSKVPSATTVPLEVPTIFLTSSLPSLIVVVGKVHLLVASPQVSEVTGPVLEALSSPWTVEVLHVSSALPFVSTRLDVVPAVWVKWILVPTAQLCPAGQGSAVVEQMTVAEALPAPINAISTPAATAARASIFACFMTSSLPAAGGHRFALRTSRANRRGGDSQEQQSIYSAQRVCSRLPGGTAASCPAIDD